jgi:hypothetical protein
MKIQTAILLLSCIAAIAQDSLVSGGNFLGSGPGAFHRRQYAEPEPESPIIKVVNGKIYEINHSYLWKLKSGTIEDISGNEILVMGQDENFILKNYHGTIALTKNVSVRAMSVGTEKFQDEGSSWSGVYEAWDCGTEPTPEQWKQIEDEEAKAQALIEKQKAEAQKDAQAKVYAAQAKAIIWLQSQATNGSVSAQCSLGLHYLNGQGCKTNKELAVYWLTQAANQGDTEASNILANLKY